MYLNKRISNLVIKAQIERVSEAGAYSLKPGEALLVHRGSLRSIIFCCPDGCGENITINLDPRAGKAWRLYKTTQGITIFPSIWRDNGCESHFIIYRNHILWCDFERDYSYTGMYESNVNLDMMVQKSLSHEFKSYVEIAEKINEIPWDVRNSCVRLVNAKKAIQGQGSNRDLFKSISEAIHI